MSDLRDFLPSSDTLGRITQELRHGSIRIGVFGEFSSGKSTFLNALMGEDLLSVAVDPTTATATRIEYDRDFNVRVLGPVRPDGSAPEVARLFPAGKEPAWARFVGKAGILSALQREGAQVRAFLERWTREGQDADQTSAVVLAVPQPFLKNRVCLVDTPGANNEFTRHHHITQQIAAQVDMAICLLDARNGGKKSELDFVLTVAATAPMTLLVVNKIDAIDADEREEVLESFHEQFRTRWPTDRGVCPVPRYCSALAALDAAMGKRHADLAADFASLRSHLMELAAQQRGRVILQRTGGHDQTLRTLAAEAERLGQLDIAHRALEDCLNLYREADIEDPHLVDQYTRIEQALQTALPQVNEANRLLDQVERLLQAHAGAPTAAMRQSLLRATLLLRQANQIDERLERLRQQMDRPAAEVIRDDLARDIPDFLKSFPAPGDRSYCASVAPERFATWKRAAEFGIAEARLFLGVCSEHGLQGLPKDELVATSWYEQAANQGVPQAQNRMGHRNEYGPIAQGDHKRALSWYRKAAEQGYAVAQQNIGENYFCGYGVPKDNAEAMRWFLLAANQGYRVSQYRVGELCDIADNITDAVIWYRKAAEQGHSLAQFVLGFNYYNGRGVEKDLHEAVRWYRKAAEQGLAGAQCNLGVCFENGTGVAQDINEAVRWYRKSAEQECSAAQYFLGLCYEHGIGVAQNASEAVLWYRKAADQGHAVSQLQLGICYDNGIGTTQSPAEAVLWYRKAAEQGIVDAQRNLGISYDNGMGIAQDPCAAALWYRKAAHQGDSQSQYYFGLCCARGRGVPQNLSESVVWYRKAADQDLPAAQSALGVCYHNGVGVERNYTTAVYWYLKAAEQGDISAQSNMGICCEFGYGVIQDHAAAVQWYGKASESGFADAQYRLGEMYYSGLVVRKNLSEAADLYYKAAEQGHAEAQNRIGVCYWFGYGVGVQKPAALFWWKKAAAQGSTNAEHNLRMFG